MTTKTETTKKKISKPKITKKSTVKKSKSIVDKTDKSINKLGKYFEAVGRRKTAVARVRFFQDKNKEDIVINEKKLNNYFPIQKHRNIALDPIKTLSLKDYYITIKVSGSGVNSQAEAIRLGISRALIKLDESWRSQLKQLGFLRRDPRMVERKHPGLRKARRPQQWRKR